jgi:hypothetical protein
MIECRHGQVIISVFSWDLLAALSLRGSVASWLRGFTACHRRHAVTTTYSSNLPIVRSLRGGACPDIIGMAPSLRAHFSSWLRGFVASWL